MLRAVAASPPVNPEGLLPPGGTTGQALAKTSDADYATGWVNLGDIAGQLVIGQVPNAFITFAKMQDIASDRLIGRDTAGSGSPEEIAVTGGLEFTGSQSIQRSALTGDVTASAGSGSTTIANNAVTTVKILDANVTDAKISDRAALSVFGRASNSSGVGADIVAGSDGDVLQRSGTSVVFAPITAASIPANSITLGKLQQITTDRLLGRDTTGTGDVEQLTATGGIEFTGTGIQTSAFTGNVTKAAGGTVLTIGSAQVTDAMITNRTALSVFGRSANSSGVGADIAGSASSDAVLRINGTSLGFGTVATAGIANNAVTFAKFQQITTDRLVGRDTALTGNVEEISVSGGLEWTGGPGIQRSALTGDVTASAGSNATTIANNAVTNAKFRQSGALAVVGRSANSTGNVADIQGTASSGQVLRVSGTTLGFGTVATAGIANSAVTLAKIANAAANSKLLGSGATGSGSAYTEITLGTNLSMSGTTLNASGGGLTAASQAQMEAATDNTVGATPAVAQFHPSACKFWGYVTYNGAGVPTLQVSYNLTSVTDTATGRLGVTIATDFSTANWAPWVGSTTSAATKAIASVVSLAAGTCEVNWYGSGGGLIDPANGEGAGFGGFGDQ